MPTGDVFAVGLRDAIQWQGRSWGAKKVTAAQKVPLMGRRAEHMGVGVRKREGACVPDGMGGSGSVQWG